MLTLFDRFWLTVNSFHTKLEPVASIYSKSGNLNRAKSHTLVISLLQGKELVIELLDFVGELGGIDRVDVAHVTSHLPRQQRIPQVIVNEKCSFRFLKRFSTVLHGQ